MVAEGRMELESGAWRWRLEDLAVATGPYKTGLRPESDADPDAEADAERSEEDGGSVLVLEDLEDPEHWMAREIPWREGDPSESELHELARDPDLRQVVDDDGRVWRIESLDKPAAVREDAAFERSTPKIRAAKEGGPERVVSLPDGGRLGTLRRDALLEAIRE